MKGVAGLGIPAVANASAVLVTLAILVVKEGVMLGGLSAAHQAAALGLAACALPADVVLREADVNMALKHSLSASCSFLAVDHVELRRWLVDAGWLSRDGFGREYRRVAPEHLPEAVAPIAAALAGITPDVWVREVRQRAAAAREARRLAWEAGPSQGKGTA